MNIRLKVQTFLLQTTLYNSRSRSNKKILNCITVQILLASLKIIQTFEIYWNVNNKKKENSSQESFGSTLVGSQCGLVFTKAWIAKIDLNIFKGWVRQDLSLNDVGMYKNTGFN